MHVDSPTAERFDQAAAALQRLRSVKAVPWPATVGYAAVIHALKSACAQRRLLGHCRRSALVCSAGACEGLLSEGAN